MGKFNVLHFFLNHFGPFFLKQSCLSPDSKFRRHNGFFVRQNSMACLQQTQFTQNIWFTFQNLVSMKKNCSVKTFGCFFTMRVKPGTRVLHTNVLHVQRIESEGRHTVDVLSNVIGRFPVFWQPPHHKRSTCQSCLWLVDLRLTDFHN